MILRAMVCARCYPTHPALKSTRRARLEADSKLANRSNIIGTVAITGTRRQAKMSAMASLIPDDPDALLTRARLTDALNEAGYPTSAKTLATKATRGGGPKFRKYGPRPLYRWADALEWARSRLGPIVNSTAELDALTPGRQRPRSKIKVPAEHPVSALDGKKSPHQQVIESVEAAHLGASESGRKP